MTLCCQDVYTSSDAQYFVLKNIFRDCDAAGPSEWLPESAGHRGFLLRVDLSFSFITSACRLLAFGEKGRAEVSSAGPGLVPWGGQCPSRRAWRARLRPLLAPIGWARKPGGGQGGTWASGGQEQGRQVCPQAEPPRQQVVTAPLPSPFSLSSDSLGQHPRPPSPQAGPRPPRQSQHPGLCREDQGGLCCPGPSASVLPPREACAPVTSRP